MKSLSLLVTALPGALLALPASAHVTTATDAHWHASDALGLLAVVALTALAAWIDRRGRHGR